MYFPWTLRFFLSDDWRLIPKVGYISLEHPPFHPKQWLTPRWPMTDDQCAIYFPDTWGFLLCRQWPKADNQGRIFSSHTLVRRQWLLTGDQGGIYLLFSFPINHPQPSPTRPHPRYSRGEGGGVGLQGGGGNFMAWKEYPNRWLLYVEPVQKYRCLLCFGLRSWIKHLNQKRSCYTVWCVNYGMWHSDSGSKLWSLLQPVERSSPAWM